ncbi:MAG: VCBS repeat-containing protein [Chitinophagaceae bacterium]
MKFCFLILCISTAITHENFAQSSASPAHQKQSNTTSANYFPNFNRTLLLEEKTDTTANASFADFDGDGHPDILLVKGRHWPIIDRILLGDGSGKIRKAYNLSSVADRSYTGGVADFNGDGFPDIAVSNDYPDRKLVYFNDGKGNFTVGAEFGIPKWPTRNLSIADLNADGSPDLILANRGRPGQTSNYLCLNNGKGQFDSNCIAFAPYPATTILPADINQDGFIDLVVPHRDGGQSYVYLGGADKTYSDARRIKFGAADASIRTAASADFNGDGLPDIVAIDEFKGVNLYLGQKDPGFAAGVSLEDSTRTPYALTIADLNNDRKMDIIIGHVEAPSTIFFNNGTTRDFKSISFGDSKGTVYGFAVGDFDRDGLPDIVAARSEAQCVLYFGSVR